MPRDQQNKATGTTSKKYWTPGQVASEFGLTIGTLSHWRYKRIGPKYYRLNRKKIIYLQKDIDEWAQANPILTRDSID